MKKFLVIGFSMVAAVTLLNSCNKEPDHSDELIPVENPFENATPEQYYGYAEISVPAATEKVYIEYKKQDGSIATIEQAVTPKLTIPTDGKDVEPFGTVKLMFKSDTPAMVQRVYYRVHDLTKADGNEEDVYTLQEVMVTKPSFGEFGKTRYVQMPREFAWTNSAETGWKETQTYPKDVVFYDKTWNHTLRYTYAYAGGVAGEAYFLTDCYEIKDHIVTAIKNQSCESCGTGCPYCMPWGCSCGCKKDENDNPILNPNPDFKGSGDLTAQAQSDGNSTVVKPDVPGMYPTGDGGYVVVDKYGTIIVDYAPADLNTTELPEPAYYKTTDSGFTMYHSSGVVMFDDRWPELPSMGFHYDYNDVVIDYDIEALTVSDELLASEGWREKIKVTMHIRSLGGDDAIGAGVVLENFNTEYVDHIEESKTLDSGNHGKLPIWTETTLQENSLHYDPLAKVYRTENNLRPAVEIGRLQALNSVDGKSTGGKTSGNEVYQYQDNKGNSYDHVFNPARRQWASWETPHEEQYDAEALNNLYKESINKDLNYIQGFKLYNTVPGYINVAGGLYTYTVEYYMKPRIEMEPEERAAVLANMVETVVNTNKQNFYIVKKDHGAVGLKGYAPLDVPVKDFSQGYRSQYDKIVAEKAANMDQSTYYLASNGMVWGFKCPTLTRHAWELMPFVVAYPNYRAWVESKGESHADWYKDADVNPVAIVCEW